MKQFIILLLFLNNIYTYCQIIPTENLFTFESIDQQKNIRISERIKDEWNLENYFIQLTYYNAHKDNAIDSIQSITQVLSIHYLLNNTREILELLDDGRHFDKEANDGIYANFLVDDFTIFRTDESIIDVQMDTMGINYLIIYPPVNYLPEIPKIIIPKHEAEISSTMPEVSWEIDPKADGCGVILVENTPSLGKNLEGIIWEKEYSMNTISFSEKISAQLSNNHTYTLIIWSYTNTKLVNNQWSRGAYSLQWSKFQVNALDKKKELILSQNYPNPFNSKTIISYYLPEEGNVSIKIFNIMGRQIATLVKQIQTPGEQYVSWSGKDNFGNIVVSGVYFYTLLFNDHSLSQKMMFVR